VVVVVVVCLSVGAQQRQEVVGALGMVVVFDVVGLMAVRGEQLGGFCLWMSFLRLVVVVGYVVAMRYPFSVCLVRRVYPLFQRTCVGREADVERL
jgi:hypothetical protein